MEALNNSYPKQSVTDRIGMEFVLIPAGTFHMGSNKVHTVQISRPFYMGKYEVTQAQWEVVKVIIQASSKVRSSRLKAAFLKSSGWPSEV